jgi:hypothetical protein
VFKGSAGSVHCLSIQRSAGLPKSIERTGVIGKCNDLLIPSREAANCAATQELPYNLRNPKVHYRVHKSPSLVSILSQIDPVHTILSYLSQIRLNIGFLRLINLAPHHENMFKIQLPPPLPSRAIFSRPEQTQTVALIPAHIPRNKWTQTANSEAWLVDNC